MVEHKGKSVVIVVNSIESDLQIHSVSLAPATWGLASDSSAVNINGGHDLGLSLDRVWSKFAVELLGTISDVRELSAQEIYICTSARVTSVGENIV